MNNIDRLIARRVFNRTKRMASKRRELTVGEPLHFSSLNDLNSFCNERILCQAMILDET